MAGIHVFQVEAFGKSIASHKVVIGWFSLIFGGIAYSVFKPKSYDINKYVEGLSKEEKDVLKAKNVKI